MRGKVEIADAQCSTPNGIKASKTSFQWGIRQSASECSTPNGIKASKTHDLVENRDSQIVCSTPNGIKASKTSGGAPVPSTEARVLNA